MRKLILLAVAAVTAAGAVGVAQAVNPTTAMKASVSPSKKGTTKKPKNVKLNVELITTPSAGDAPFATKTTVVHFDKNLKFGGKNLKQCSQSQVQSDDTKCPKGSKVGSGSASGVALGLTENLTVTAYNGPGGNKLELLVDGQSPLQIHSVIEGKLLKDSGLYGSKLSVAIPETLQQPAPGAYATLVQFDTTINKVLGSKKRPYVGINSCKTKKMAFGVDYKYTDGTTKSTTTSAACS
jgi:hypothetical protein